MFKANDNRQNEIEWNNKKKKNWKYLFKRPIRRNTIQYRVIQLLDLLVSRKHVYLYRSFCSKTSTGTKQVKMLIQIFNNCRKQHNALRSKTAARSIGLKKTRFLYRSFCFKTSTDKARLNSMTQSKWKCWYKGLRTVGNNATHYGVLQLLGLLVWRKHDFFIGFWVTKRQQIKRDWIARHKTKGKCYFKCLTPAGINTMCYGVLQLMGLATCFKKTH